MLYFVSAVAFRRERNSSRPLGMSCFSPLVVAYLPTYLIGCIPKVVHDSYGDTARQVWEWWWWWALLQGRPVRHDCTCEADDWFTIMAWMMDG